LRKTKRIILHANSKISLKDSKFDHSRNEEVHSATLVLYLDKSDNPINTLCIPFQNPILDHVTPDSCGVIVVLGDDRVEFLLGILGGGG
jgi:hypothetical protein